MGVILVEVNFYNAYGGLLEAREVEFDEGTTINEARQILDGMSEDIAAMSGEPIMYAAGAYWEFEGDYEDLFE